ncbi:MAG: hypothetical protein R3F62_19630 [Planctomycetota bacterium]
MTHDWSELRRLANLAALERLCADWLEQARVEDPAVLAALAPELEGPAAQAFLQLVAGNLAFQLRTRPALQAWLRRCAEGLPYSPAPAALGRLLVRCRSARVLEGWLAEVSAPAELAAAIAPLPAPEVDLILVEAELEALEEALPAACGGERRAYSRAPEDAWRHALLPPAGGFCAVLRAGDRLGREVAERLRNRAGIHRVLWLGLGGDAPEVWVHAPGAELELPPAPLTPDDVAGVARALGALALDPEHPRTPASWRFAHYAEARRTGVRYVAVVPPGS